MPSTIVLHAISSSTCTKRVGLVLYEKRIPFKIEPVDYVTQLKSPEFLKKQPFGQVPVLEDDGFFLFESRAIGKYLGAKFAEQGTKDLVPTLVHGDVKDPAQVAEALRRMAKFEEAASVESFDFEAVIAPILMEGWAAKFANPDHVPDQAKLDKFVVVLEGKLDGYERILSKQAYIAGDNLTVIDLYHLPHGTFLPMILGKDPIDNEAKRPNVARWWRELQARESWQAVKDEVQARERYD